MQQISDMLPDIQTKPYLQALLTVARVDGLLPVELEYIRDQAEVLGHDLDALMEEDSLALGELGRGCNDLTKKAILRDCILLACIDNDFSDQERTKIAEICKILDLDVSLVSRFEDWLQRYDALLKEGARLMGRD